MLWKASIRNINYIANIVPNNNFIIVRYEQLVTKPKETVIEICGMIGEIFEEQMLNVDTNNSSYSDSKSGIFTSSLDKWKSLLSPEEIFIAQILVGTEMRALDYPAINININWFKMLVYFISSPWALVQALSANKDMYSKPIPFLLRRITALVKKPRTR